jgi:enamine deaminase RidA (YjgF/YER057c/UK114 family)
VVSIESRLADLGIELPPAPAPVASYVPVVVSGPFAFVSGQIPMSEGALMWTGRLGESIEVAAGADAARRCALQALAVLRDAVGSLDRVARVVKLTVWVASTEAFIDQPKVANGASDLLVEVFGEAGRHARAAVAAPVLPLGSPVEVELLVELSSG